MLSEVSTVSRVLDLVGLPSNPVYITQAGPGDDAGIGSDGMDQGIFDPERGSHFIARAGN